MKRFTMFLAVALVAAIAIQAIADGDHGKAGTKTADAKTEKKMDKAAEKSMTVMGEIVDTGCYLGHEAKGEKHESCATKCIANGMPMGILTSDGSLYLLTPNHDNPDAYNSLKKMAAKMVSVSGMKMERNGMKAIDVMAFKSSEKAEEKAD